LALAEGLAANLKIKDHEEIVYAFDKFTADDDYVVNCLHTFGECVEASSSFLPIYLQTVSMHLKRIKILEGDLLEHHWYGYPIEILFIDIAKTEDLNKYIVRSWFPALIPEVSIVVHQDWHMPYLPYIIVSMALLSSFFSIVEEKVDDSASFMLTRRITLESIGKLLRNEFTPAEKIDHVDALICKFQHATKQYLLLAKSVLLLSLGEREAGCRLFVDTTTRFAGSTDARWARYSGGAYQMFFETLL
jgi:hypothetical protein